MAAERILSKLVGGAASALLVGGCVSAASTADLASVRELARAPILASVADTAVEPETSEEVRALLAQPLDADTAVRVALLGNRELRATLRELGVARGRLVQAGTIPNPELAVERPAEHGVSVELAVEYDLTSLVLAPLRARAAAAELDALRFEAAGAVVQLGYEVRTAFHAMQAAEQRLGIARQALDTFAASRDAATALLEAGNSSELDAATQIAAYERARITVAELELELGATRERLQRLLGLHGSDTSWSIQGALGPVPEALPAQERVAGGLEARALEASLELGAARHRLEAVSRRTRLQRTQGWLPDISVEGMAVRGRAEAAAGAPGDVEWALGAGIRVGLPVFDRQQGATRASLAEHDALTERYHGLIVDIRSAAREAELRVLSTHERARQFQEVILPAQQRVMRETLLQYNAMQVGVFQLLEARRDQLDVELAYVETLREYWDAIAALDALLAGRRVTVVAAASSAVPMDSDSQSSGGH